jgi:tRNA(Ile)-lysidine synthase
MPSAELVAAGRKAEGAEPVLAAEFAASMARLGPWDDARRVAVAVSGGADSMALALLTAGWGAPTALIVDHGLRGGSDAEAEHTRATLAARGIPAQVLTLTGLARGPGLPARARAARYAALEAAAAAAGLVDLLLGHHAGDQAETVLMRRTRGSGPAGLAGMAALAEGALVRRVRPLLDVPPDRLRATVRQAGLGWVDDPTNRDAAFTRVRLRTEIDGAVDGLLAQGRGHAAARNAADAVAASVLATRATLFPEGYALLTPGPIDPAVLGRLLQAISGRPFAPSSIAVAALARQLRPATLGGVRVMAAGRLGPGWLLVREAAAMEPPVPLRPGAVWDGRFHVAAASGSGAAATLGALGAAAARFRGCGLPSAVLQTLPAVRCCDVLCAVPFMDDGPFRENGSEIILSHRASPACGAPFQG